jgi:hypothetical protein
MDTLVRGLRDTPLKPPEARPTGRGALRGVDCAAAANREKAAGDTDAEESLAGYPVATAASFFSFTGN